MQVLITMLAAILLVLFVSGCTIIEKRPAASAFLGSYSTLKYIGTDEEKAQRVIDVAISAMDHISGNATVATLETEIRKQIRWDKLDAADTLVVEALLAELRYSVEKRIGDKQLMPDDVVHLRTVALSIIATAENRLYELRTAS